MTCGNLIGKLVHRVPVPAPDPVSVDVHSDRNRVVTQLLTLDEGLPVITRVQGTDKAKKARAQQFLLFKLPAE